MSVTRNWIGELVTPLYQASPERCEKTKRNGAKNKAEELLDILKEYPHKHPPTYEKLAGDLSSAYSRRINIQHRLVYQVLEKEKAVKIIRMWTHYE